MATFSKMLRPVSKNRVNLDSKIDVCIRIWHNKKTKYLPTGVKIGVRELNGNATPNWTEGMITSNEPHWIEKNKEVDRIYSNTLSMYEDCINPGLLSCDELYQYLKDGNISANKGETILSALEAFMIEKGASLSRSYKEMFNASIVRFSNWCGNKLLLSRISAETIVEYDKYLHQVHKNINGTKSKHLLSESQISKEKAHIKALLNWSERNGIVSFSTKPFSKITIPRSDRRDCAISIEEITRFKSLELSGSEAMAKDVWFLSFYVGGINYADMKKVNWSGDVISFVRSKTKGRTRNRHTIKLPVCAEAREILKKYVDESGCFVSGLKYANPRDEIGYIGKILKRIRKRESLPEELSFYSARHSFAQMAIECGISDCVVDYILGHSNNSRGIISYYSTVTPKMAGKAMEIVRNYLLEPNSYDSVLLTNVVK